MKISTFDNGSVDNNIKDSFMEAFTDLEKNFYSRITPDLDNLIKSPSDETIAKIMEYSKSFNK